MRKQTTTQVPVGFTSVREGKRDCVNCLFTGDITAESVRGGQTLQEYREILIHTAISPMRAIRSREM